MSCDEFSFLKAFFIIRAKPNILLLKINVAHSINIGIISFYGEELKFHFREQRGRAEAEAAGAGLRGEAGSGQRLLLRAGRGAAAAPRLHSVLLLSSRGCFAPSPPKVIFPFAKF